jgi:hypothetical protein
MRVGGSADVRRDVRRDAVLLQELEVLAQRRPGDVVLDVGLAFLRELLHLVVPRPERVAFAEHFERDALPQIALRLAVDDQRLDGPAQHVDEAGRDALPVASMTVFAVSPRDLPT